LRIDKTKNFFATYDITKVGHIYILSNPSLKDIIKIGFTLDNVEERASKLSRSTSIPLDFHIEHEFITESPEQVEKLVHDALKEYRVNPKKEFFRVTTEKSIEVIESILYGSENNVGVSMAQQLAYLLTKYPKRFDLKKKQEIKNIATEILNSLEELKGS
jgi:hypothetical protein